MLLQPDWPAPANIHACNTTRHGGHSLPPFDSLNLGDHVGDLPDSVRKNRHTLRTALPLPREPVWLSQVHGVRIVDADREATGVAADGSFSRSAGTVCAVMTADCLPVLFCSQAGDEVAAAHAGWRGLCNGVLETAVQALQTPPRELIAWLGPAIGPQAFEVDDEVRAQFLHHAAAAAQAFSAVRPGHWLADLYQLARQRLHSQGLTRIYGGGLCTYSDPERFYSYRRDKQTGRMATLIWME